MLQASCFPVPKHYCCYDCIRPVVSSLRASTLVADTGQCWCWSCPDRPGTHRRMPFDLWRDGKSPYKFAIKWKHLENRSAYRPICEGSPNTRKTSFRDLLASFRITGDFATLAGPAHYKPRTQTCSVALRCRGNHSGESGCAASCSTSQWMHARQDMKRWRALWRRETSPRR